MNKETKFIKDSIENLFKLIGIEVDSEVEYDKDNEMFKINLISEKEAGLLIGNRGRNLNSLQSIIKLIFYKKFDKWINMLVDVEGFRQKEIKRLEDLARKTAERAVSTGKPQTLYNLSPFQRRVVHTELAKTEEVTTKSEGEGLDRYLLVTPK